MKSKFKIIKKKTANAWIANVNYLIGSKEVWSHNLPYTKLPIPTFGTKIASQVPKSKGTIP